MAIQRFFRGWWIGLKQKKRTYQLGFPLQVELTDTTAQPDQQTQDETEKVLAAGREYLQKNQKAQQIWDALSPRHQHITALVCLGLTNRQIAAYTGLTAHTVSTYIQSILNRLGLHGKADLRLTFADWDFSDWIAPHQ